MAARFQVGKSWFKGGLYSWRPGFRYGGAGLRLDLMASRFHVGRSWFKAGPNGGQVLGRVELV
jgi:hypothetical protein